MSQIEAKVYTAAQVAELLQLGRATVYSLARDGKLPGAVKIGRALRFRRQAIDSMVDMPEASGSTH